MADGKLDSKFLSDFRRNLEAAASLWRVSVRNKRTAARNNAQARGLLHSSERFRLEARAILESAQSALTEALELIARASESLTTRSGEDGRRRLIDEIRSHFTRVFANERKELEESCNSLSSSRIPLGAISRELNGLDAIFEKLDATASIISRQHHQMAKHQPETSESLHCASSEQHPKPAVVTLHGIRTRGKWQKEITPALAAAGMVPDHYDYGFFDLLRFLWTGARKTQIENFRRYYLRSYGKCKKPPHLIAHSFGSYIACEAMRKYREIRFDRVILCGSIVEKSYPWNSIRVSGQVTKVLNELGGMDWEVRLAELAVRDAGPSGTGGGFTDAGDVVIQNSNAHFRHSDSLYPERATRLWVPFLSGREIPLDVHVPPAKINKKFKLVRNAILFLSALMVSWAFWKSINSDENASNSHVDPGPRPAPSIEANSGGLSQVENGETLALDQTRSTIVLISVEPH